MGREPVSSSVAGDCVYHSITVMRHVKDITVVKCSRVFFVTSMTFESSSMNTNQRKNAGCLHGSDYSVANRRVRRRSTRIRFFDGLATDIDARSTFRVSAFLSIVYFLKPNLSVLERPIRRFVNAAVS